MFKVLSKAKNDKERRKIKSRIKKLFNYNFFNENEFATIKDKKPMLDFADNMKVLQDYNGIGFDFETEDLRFPMSESWNIRLQK